MSTNDTAHRRLDCALLLVVVLLSTLPYIASIGFYFDSWLSLSGMMYAPDHSVTSLYRVLNTDYGENVRPVQAIYVALSFKSFGLNPLGYHLTGSALLALTTLMFYLAVSQIEQVGRWVALTVALVFSLLPHYSTTRFWFSSHQATICVGLALLGLYLLQGALSPDASGTAKWLTLLAAVVSLVLSFLSYEIAVGTIGGGLAFIGGREWMRRRESSRVLAMKSLLPVIVAGGTLLLAGGLKAHFQQRFSYQHHFYRHIGALIRHALLQCVQFNWWRYFLRMPLDIARLALVGGLSGPAAACATAIAFVVLAYYWRKMDHSAVPSLRSNLLLVAIGILLFFLGFAVFAFDLNSDFTPQDVNNRITMASALGAAFVLLGTIGALCRLVPPLVRSRVFACVVALACAGDSLIVSGCASFWTEANTRQRAILDHAVTDLKDLPGGSTILLEGSCRDVGPAPIFEGIEDSSGAFRLVLHDPQLTADVVSNLLRYGNDSVVDTRYEEPDGRYPFGSRLFVYDVARRTVTPLTSAEAARNHWHGLQPESPPGCAQVIEGHGAPIL